MGTTTTNFEAMQKIFNTDLSKLSIREINCLESRAEKYKKCVNAEILRRQRAELCESAPPQGKDKRKHRKTVRFVDPPNDENETQLERQLHQEQKKVDSDALGRISLKSLTSKDKNRLALKQVPFTWLEEIQAEVTDYMLGCCFDEVLQVWMITEQSESQVFCIPENDNDAPQVMSAPWIVHPSAIVPYIEGKSTAILCCEDLKRKRNYSIFLYMHQSSDKGEYASFKDGVECLKNECRGLTRSVGRNLMTMQSDFQNGSSLLLLNGAGGEQYFALPKSARKPCFMDACENYVVFTDLGEQHQVFQCVLDDCDWDATHFSVVRCVSNPLLPDPRKNANCLKMLEEMSTFPGFYFVSGVCIDADNWILVADARGGAIKLYDPQLNFDHRVTTDFGVPFISSWCVNKSGKALMIDLKGKSLIMAQFYCVPEVGPYVAPPTLTA